VEPFYPVASWERSLKEQGGNHVINGAKGTFDFTILWRSVGARHTQNHPMSGEEFLRGGIVELMVVVALNNFNGEAKLCGDKGEFFCQGGKGVKFNSQRKSPHSVGVIIKNEHVVFMARNTNNWRGS
jgi:hypothetical protein